jgi:hypothetical protein
VFRQQLKKHRSAWKAVELPQWASLRRTSDASGEDTGGCEGGPARAVGEAWGILLQSWEGGNKQKPAAE